MEDIDNIVEGLNILKKYVRRKLPYISPVSSYSDKILIDIEFPVSDKDAYGLTKLKWYSKQGYRWIWEVPQQY